ncbi:MAG: UDP-N-acetylmuramate dehydrogenase [Acidobacteriota bacterium]
MKKDVELAPWTTLRIGGPGDYFAAVRSIEDLDRCTSWAGRSELPVFLLGSGSNVLFDDGGFRGLVVRNELRGLQRCKDEVEVAGGEDLGGLIRFLNRQGLAGMERMYGIPGTVAGAVVGNAGAYGQEIGERMVHAEIWEEGNVRRIPASRLELRYRHSRFKQRRDWFLLSCKLRLEKSRTDLQEVSDRILRQRLEKYPLELRCPGSYFKNLLASELPEAQLKRIPEHFVQYGKIPAGMLLDAVGGKGQRCGGARVADHHANLFINDGKASARDLIELSSRLAERVQERFGVALEPEIRIVGGSFPSNLPSNCPAGSFPAGASGTK